jgi:hypothetical protein
MIMKYNCYYENDDLVLEIKVVVKNKYCDMHFEEVLRNDEAREFIKHQVNWMADLNFLVDF